MTHSDIEEIYNRTFAGLTLYYRDTDLTEKLISKYYPGQILHERGFTDMTYKGGGLSGNTRYLIASANGKDISALSPDMKDYGHILLTAGSYFKVLDISEAENKTQIFLLEIPSDTIDFFTRNTSGIENEITEKAKQNFLSKIQLEPLPELSDKDWLERTSYPIGMNECGKLFYDETEKPSGENQTVPRPRPWWKLW